MKITRNLIERIITIIIAIPFFYWLLLRADRLWFEITCVLLAGMAALEWGKLLGWEKTHRYAFAGYNIVLPIGLILLLLDGGKNLVSDKFLLYFLITVSLLWLFAVPYALYRYAKKGQIHLPNWLAIGVGMAMIWGFVFALTINYRLIGGAGLLGLFVVVWSSDIGAYLAGKIYGKHKIELTTHISPNKTLEGFISGFLLAMIVAGILAFLVKLPVNLIVFLPLSAVAVIYAAVGDLWESMLKRRADVKDSGNIIPGHGGLLDRIDSWLPAMVIWAVGFLAFLIK